MMSTAGCLRWTTGCVSGRAYAMAQTEPLDVDVIFQMAEVAVPKRLFRAMLARIRRLHTAETVPG